MSFVCHCLGLADRDARAIGAKLFVWSGSIGAHRPLCADCNEGRIQGDE